MVRTFPFVPTVGDRRPAQRTLPLLPAGSGRLDNLLDGAPINAAVAG